MIFLFYWRTQRLTILLISFLSPIALLTNQPTLVWSLLLQLVVLVSSSNSIAAMNATYWPILFSRTSVIDVGWAKHFRRRFFPCSKLFVMTSSVRPFTNRGINIPRYDLNLGSALQRTATYHLIQIFNKFSDAINN